MKKRVLAGTIAAFVLTIISYHSTSARAATAAPPLCSSSDIAASILGTEGAAGTIRTRVGLVNISKHRCALPAYPLLTFGAHGDLYHVALTHAGTAGTPLNVSPGNAATLILQWSNVDGAAGPCTKVADMYVNFPTRGMPLWIPVEAKACNPMEQLPITAAQTHGLPTAKDAAAAFDHWFELQQCEGRLLYLSTHARFATPAHPDALRLGMQGASVAFDPSVAVLAQTSSGKGSANLTVCGLNSSIPYGIARLSLRSVATTNGVRIGTSLAQAQQLDGTAPVIDLGGNYSAIAYRWTSNGEEHLLNLLFYEKRTFVIDYVERSPAKVSP